MKIKKCFCIIGTGALGGYYGSLLCKAGFTVHFLARSDYDHIKNHGLRIESPLGDFNLNDVKVYRSSSDMPQADIVIIALKAYCNPQLNELLPSLVTPKTAVVLLQNGIGEEELLSGIVPADRIFGALSFICASKPGPGLIRHQDYGAIRIGCFVPINNKGLSSSPLLDTIVNDFASAGIDVSPVDDLIQARWEKLVWNIPFSGLSIVLDANTKQIVTHPDSLALSRLIIRDVADAASACNKPVDSSFQKKMIDNTVCMVPYIPSIKLDYDRGKPLEIEAIFGNPLRAAQKAGYAAPYIEFIYRTLGFLDRSRFSKKEGRR